MQNIERKYQIRSSPLTIVLLNLEVSTEARQEAEEKKERLDTEAETHGSGMPNICWLRAIRKAVHKGIVILTKF
jgi:hypothetical protein